MPDANAVETDEFFLRQASTFQPLRELTSADELVFYCGAGVSIDRTGVSWPQTVSGLFGVAYGNRLEDHLEVGLGFDLIRHLNDPRQAASILVQSFATQSQGDNKFLGSKLKDVLYGHEAGIAAPCCAISHRHSLAAARHGRQVLILTTNYDIHIELEFIARLDALLGMGIDPADAPGLRRRILRGDKGKFVRKPGANAAFRWCLLARSCRRRRDGGGRHCPHRTCVCREPRAIEHCPEGRVAGPKKGVLTIGASSTDEPLIHALAETREQRGHRFSLVTVPRSLRDVDGKEFDGTDTKTTISSATVTAALDLVIIWGSIYFTPSVTCSPHSFSKNSPSASTRPRRRRSRPSTRTKEVTSTTPSA